MTDPLREPDGVLRAWAAFDDARGSTAAELLAARAVIEALRATYEPLPDHRFAALREQRQARDLRVALEAYDAGEGRPPLHASSRDVQWPAGGRCNPEPAEPPAPEGAVRVRIAVAVDADGEWSAAGDSEDTTAESVRAAYGSIGDDARLSWVEAWVPRPEAEQVVEGRVAPEGE